jgi:catechol 2,3-dioxygenase-like lactoylglutathione lyase family enzyme
VSREPSGPRLRHLAIVCRDLDASVDALAHELGLHPPFRDDPLAGDWGVANAIFALGDRFLEAMAPVWPDTAAARHLQRRGGDSGYMVMFQVPDVIAARARARDRDVRLVWEHDGPDMSGTHLHPADMEGGAIVALDQSTPPESWRWAGPDWVGGAGTGAPAEIRSATVAVPDPARTAARWASVLGVDPVPDVRFVAGDAGLCEIELALPDAVRAGRDAVEIGGVRFVLRPA